MGLIVQHTHTHNHHGYVGVFSTNQPYLFHFLYKSTMTELVSSGCLKSNTPRADRKQAAVVSCWDKGERESREKEEGGSEWMRKEGGKVRMSNG